MTKTDDFHFVRIQRPSVVKEVVEQLGSYILHANLQPGARLPAERDLMEMLGVSRSSLREALRMLEQSGLVTVRKGPNGGTFVADAVYEQATSALGLAFRRGRATMDELLETREVLEGQLARLAAERATSADLERIREPLELSEAHLDSEEIYLKCNSEFHAAIAEASHNQVLLMLMRSILDLVDQSTASVPLSDESIRASVAGHRRIYEQIVAGHPHGAETASRQHIRNFRRRVEGAAHLNKEFEL